MTDQGTHVDTVPETRPRPRVDGRAPSAPRTGGGVDRAVPVATPPPAGADAPSSAAGEVDRSTAPGPTEAPSTPSSAPSAPTSSEAPPASAPPAEAGLPTEIHGEAGMPVTTSTASETGPTSEAAAPPAADDRAEAVTSSLVDLLDSEAADEIAAIGRPSVPDPPQPPFERAPEPFWWQVVLPGSLGRQVTIRLGGESVDLAGTVVPRDEIVRARFKLTFEDALLRRAASARMRIDVECRDGRVVKVAARNAASSSRASTIVDTITYLWSVLGDIDGEERTSVVERIERGGEVAIGNVRFTSIGVAWKRNPIVTWSHIGEPFLDRTTVIIPTDEGAIDVPLTIDGAFMLPEVTRVLRARFG